MLAPRAPFTPLCPVKFMTMKSEAYFTGVGPVDRTGVKFTFVRAKRISPGSFTL